MIRSTAAFAGLLGTCLLTVTPAMACSGTKAVFEDKFAAIDPAWPNLAANYGKSVDGHLSIDVPQQTPAANYASHSLNQSNVYSDAAVCVSFSFATAQDADNTFFGLAFWGTDDNNYYTFNVSASGFYEVIHKVADARFLYPVPWTTSPLVKKELNATNEIEVQMKQNAAELFINGTKVADIKGSAPAGGGTVGLFYQLPAAGGKMTVSDFQVRN